MRLIKRILSFAGACLLSFIGSIRRNDRRGAVCRVIAMVCALTVLFSGLSIYNFAASDIDGLHNKSIKLDVNTEATDSTVTLNGLMPRNAVATVTDVTEDYSDKNRGFESYDDPTSVIAAYDITITNGETEYQPGEKAPIHVEIAHPKISGDTETKVVHIKDDGTREEIEDYTIEDGKLSFYATGFSIYEIVEINNGGVTGEIITNTDDLTDPANDELGFFLYYVPKDANSNDDLPPKYFTSEVNDAGALVETTDETQAAVWHFEKSGDSYNLYTYVNNQQVYLHNISNTRINGGNGIELSSTTADLLDLELTTQSPKGFYFKLHDVSKWLQHSGSGNGIRYYKDKNNLANSRIFIKQNSPASLDVSAVEKLVEKPYGLFHYSNGSTVGNALMAEGDTHSLVRLVITAKGKNRVLYVDEDNEIDQWQFNYDANSDMFTISVQTSSGTEYLCADSNGVSTTDNPASAGLFHVSISEDHRVQLESNGYYVNYEPRAQDQGGSRFSVTRNPAEGFTWLNLLDSASLDSDMITFSADRVSVSDIPSGKKVIVYIRVWNEEELRYDMYAVDRDGSLYPCFASGGKLEWLGDSTGSLEWEFTEYLDPVTKLPNYYYELYNPYSEKYLAPQMAGNQVLSENPIGINIPGRRDGEFYSNVIAWDNTRYAYIGLRPNADKTALEPCSESAALPFYFATLEELNLSDRLHEVPTLDNNQYGIKMRMVNFDLQPGKSYGDSRGSEFTWEYFDGGGIDKLTPNLLSRWLQDNGYPTATPTGRNIINAFTGAKSRAVNHLFLESVHSSSGYFDFDSTQNFATLKQQNGNGTVSWNPGDNGETDFIVYHELGTHDRRTDAFSLKHGQFYPYDTILPGVYCEGNPQNVYSSLTSPTDGSMGRLKENDPRKYEKLHLLQSEKANADFYFGMEMEASFVQTPSGLDAWGHDIIFEFTGDDDFWLYVDNQLVLDLGGTHSALMGTINFRTGDVYYDKKDAKVHGTMGHSTLREIFEDNYRYKYPNATDAEVEEYLAEYFEDGETVFKDYSNHTMRMFYMERGANASNLHMRFNIAAVTPGNVVVNKSVSGEGADALDMDFLEYPFQIYYTVPDGPNHEPSDWILLENDDDLVRVTYQNNGQPVNFVRRYRPPGLSEDQAYENIYFINPTKNAEISFPDDAMTYKIVECAVNPSVYGDVTINGEEVPAERVEIRGDLRSYSSESGSALARPSISFDNHVNKNVIKDLLVTKKLLDENNQEVTDDPATFNFRLAISSVEVPISQIPLANMYNYLVLSPDKNICRYDPETQGFVDTSILYNRANYKSIQNGEVSGLTADDVTFKTSGFGSISGIPAGYTICVPGLPVGSVFKVTEEPKNGYGLMGYEQVLGSKTLENHEVVPIPSYYLLDNDMVNAGKVIAEEDPQMEVHNRKGYGISVKKEWSDLSKTTGHSTIYTAVYVDGQLLEGSVKEIKSPSTSANYFWTTLQPQANGSPRTDLSGYVIKEVTISNQDPIVSDDGTVTNYGTVTPLSSGDRINLVATRIASETPAGESPDKAYYYIVSYAQNSVTESTREDTVKNTREGGIAIRLFKWNSTDPLSNGQFTLTDSAGTSVGTYYSDSAGIVTILYDFVKNQNYTLTETAAPRGYVGLQKKLCFKVNNDGSVSLFYEDGDVWGTKQDCEDDTNWASAKLGSYGLSAYVDIYNKPFNFKLVKMDNVETGLMLDNAHFALYKQTNTTIGGYEKNRDPLTGFEDMVTVNGELYICGGDSGRSINPGANGSVYFLTEIQAPLNYTKLEDDIIFRVSPLGKPELIGDSYNGQLVETEDSFIYTLSVPNEKKNDKKVLTVRKVVTGSSFDTEQQFTFTFTVDGAAPSDVYEWYKNGVAQSEGLHSGDNFYLKHDEYVEISVPQDASVTVSEQSGNYTTTIQLDDDPEENTRTKTFTVEDDSTLVVTNTVNQIVPTGVFDNTFFWLEFALLLIGFSAVYLWYRKKRYNHPFRRS